MSNSQFRCFKELGITTVHEAVYALAAPQRVLISDGRTEPAILRRMHANRRAVSDWLAQYDQAGIRVVLAVLGQAPGPRSNENNEEFSTWIAELIASHPSITAVQMHNEPNLRSFWRGTPEDYVDTYRSYATKIRAKRADVRLLVERSRAFGGGLASSGSSAPWIMASWSLPTVSRCIPTM